MSKVFIGGTAREFGVDFLGDMPDKLRDSLGGVLECKGY